MITMGIRVEPSAVTFVLYDTTEKSIINSEKLKVPKALSLPLSLKYIRVNIIDILREYKVEMAGIRITEGNAQRPSILRVQIEAIIIETFASSTLINYYCGQIAKISKFLEIDRIDFKKYIDGELEFENVENWGEFSKVEREACLAAIGAAYA